MIRPSEHRPTQAIINLEAMRHNIDWMRQKMNDQQKLFATVKANAYGHGAVPIAKAAISAGCEGLAVATVDEAIELRQSGLSQIPILVLGLTDPQGIAEILHYNITITVSGLDFFEAAYHQLADTKQTRLLDLYKLNFHLALDTGMGRIGLREVTEVEAFAAGIQAYPWAHWQGVFTHFATAGGGPADYIEAQWQRWLDLMGAVPATVDYRHYANSAMGLWHPKLPASDIVRMGISMYGLDPKDQLPSPAWGPDYAVNEADDLQPILELITEIVHVKKVPAGACISYGATYQAREDEWIATLPIGYGDGWLRYYKNLPILVDGHECPVVGVINMDQLMIRLPKHYPVGTIATLIGPDGSFNNHASYLAQQVDTIAYEIVTNLSPRIARVYLNED
ncbi:alanine racemase [Hutsoniella sourekii]